MFLYMQALGYAIRSLRVDTSMPKHLRGQQKGYSILRKVPPPRQGGSPVGKVDIRPICICICICLSSCNNIM